MKKIVLFICVLLILTTTRAGFCGRSGASVLNEGIPSAPTLLYPIRENVSIPSDGMLKFAWEMSYFTYTDYYIFKLYKGYATSDSDLIMSKQIPSGQYSLELPASQFQDGQVYTWILVQVLTTGTKSDKG